MPVKVVCKTCGEGFTCPPSAVKAGRKYCSRKCADKGRSLEARVALNCDHCGETFELLRFEAKTRKYCSLGCANEDHISKTALTCPTCGDSFNVKKSHASRRKYCSLECRHTRDESAHTVTDCMNCGKSFEVLKSRFDHGRGQYCSSDCQYESIRGTRRSPIVACACLNCSQTFEVREKSLDPERGDGKYCSRDCRDDHRRGEDHPQYIHGSNADYYGSNWQAQRRKARERDNHICQHCGATDTVVDVHHIEPRRWFDVVEDANDLYNLITLCKPCHRKADAKIQALEAAE